MTANSDFDAFMDTLYALIRLMEEESEQLASSGPSAAMEELARAKVLLTSRLDELNARLDRQDRDWVEQLDEDHRRQLAEANEELRKAATVNSAILERQISLSTELLQAVGLELERMAGRRSTTYGRFGDIRRRQASAPLALNQRY